MLPAASAFAALYVLDPASSAEALADAVLRSNGPAPNVEELERFKPIVLLRDTAAEADRTYALTLLRRLHAALLAAADRSALVVSFGSEEEMGIGMAKEGLVLFDASTSR